MKRLFDMVKATVGLNGRLFRIFKFRSMVVNADKIGPSSTASEHPRITRIGKWIRAHKLDELPQLLNPGKGAAPKRAFLILLGICERDGGNEMVSCVG